MTVKELISELEKCPQDAEIYAESYDDTYKELKVKNSKCPYIYLDKHKHRYSPPMEYCGGM